MCALFTAMQRLGVESRLINHAFNEDMGMRNLPGFQSLDRGDMPQRLLWQLMAVLPAIYKRSKCSRPIGERHRPSLLGMNNSISATKLTTTSPLRSHRSGNRRRLTLHLGQGLKVGKTALQRPNPVKLQCSDSFEPYRLLVVNKSAWHKSNGEFQADGGVKLVQRTSVIFSYNPRMIGVLFSNKEDIYDITRKAV